MASNKFCDRCGRDAGDSGSRLEIEAKGFSIYRTYDLCLDCAIWVESVIRESTGGHTAKATEPPRMATGNIFIRLWRIIHKNSSKIG